MKKITLLMLIIFTTITLKSQNKLVSSIDEYYNGTSWQKSRGVNYEYDSNNNLITQTGYTYDFLNSSWAFYEKTIYVYDASNKVTLQTEQSWNTTTQKFENSYRETTTYTSGKYAGGIVEDWNSTTANWDFNWKNVLSYNSNNLPDNAVFYNWNGLQWVLDSRETLTYNGVNKIISDLSENWISSQWVNSRKTLLTYDANNKIVTSRSADWDDFNSNFGPVKDRTDYVLDATGNRISETQTFTGVINNKKDYTYNTSSLMSSFANPFKDKTGIDYLFEDFPHVNKPLGYNYFSYNTSTSTFENTSRTIYDYTNAIVLAIDKFETTNPTIAIFPNPTQGLLNIVVTEFSPSAQIIITDMLGKTKYSKKTEQVNTVTNTSGYAKGIYLVTVADGSKKGVKKLMVE